MLYVVFFVIGSTNTTVYVDRPSCSVILNTHTLSQSSVGFDRSRNVKVITLTGTMQTLLWKRHRQDLLGDVLAMREKTLDYDLLFGIASHILGALRLKRCSCNIIMDFGRLFQ